MKPLLKLSLIAVGVLAAGLLAIQQWQVRPHVNPNPVKRVVVRGVFPYAQGWELRLRQDFFTSNPECKRSARLFFVIPMAIVAREVQIPVAVKRIDDEHYEAEYFEDHYLSGHCEWTAGFLYADPVRGKENMYGGAILGFPKKYNKIDYRCHALTANAATGPVVYASCFEGDNRSFDPARKIGEVNFNWTGDTK